MRVALLVCLLLLLATVVGVAQGAGVPEPEGAEPGDLAVIESTQDGVVLELVLPSFDSEETQVLGDTYQLLRVADWLALSAEGKPQLPVRSVLVGVPPGAEVELQILKAEPSLLQGYNVYPAPRYVVPRPGPDAEPVSGHELSELPSAEFSKDEELYSRDAFYPPRTAIIVESGYIRHQAFARLELRPFQFNPGTGQLRIQRTMRVALRFSYPKGRPAEAWETVDEPQGFDDLLRASIVNYDSARSWRKRALPTEIGSGLTGVQEPQYKVFVDEDGIYEITYGDLESVGVPLNGIAPSEIQLSNRGEEVAIHVFGQGDDTFDEEDSILFFGQKAGTKYTDTNVYWLAFGQGVGLRMDLLDGTPGAATVPDSFWDTLHFEQDQTYQALYPEGSGKDHWFWSFMRIQPPASRSYVGTVENPVPETYSATLRVNLLGYRPVDHSVGITLTGHGVGRVDWSGAEEITRTEDVHSPFVLEGENELTLSPALPDAYPDIVYMNWFELDYRRSFSATDDLLFFSVDSEDTWKFEVTDFSTEAITVCDVTDPLSPALVVHAEVSTGGPLHTVRFEAAAGPDTRFIATTRDRWITPRIEEDEPSDLRSTEHGADYIIIAPEEFHAAVLPLAQYRASQGLRVQVVDLQDVYDEFGHGLLDPEAIRGFLSYAFHSWAGQAPTYVVLAGDGHFDFKDNLGTHEPSPVPPYLEFVDTEGGETAADNRYVTVSGDDALPDIHIGRLPGNTSSEIATMVQKTLDFEQKAPGTVWSGNLVFVSDDAESYPNDFPALSDLIADTYPSPAHRVTKVYLGETCPHENPSVICKNQYLDALRDPGTMLLNYIGHGALEVWASERLLLTSDIPGLTNGEKTYIHIAMTCNDGRFHYPGYPSLGESVVRVDGRGAAAAWSPTGKGYTLGHSQLQQGFYSAFFWEGMRTLGDLTLAGKLRLLGSGINPELVDLYHLFGDPALRLPFYWAVSLPVVLREAP